MPSGRLIQLVVECGNAIAPVEIRPFTSWQPTTAPAQRALRHVTEDQAWLAAACGFLWLPYAHGSWPLRPFGRRTGLVSVAFGSPHALTRAIAHRMHQPRT
ncbi:MAG TPA: hypothetical protein VFQ88_15250 [Nevskiaceae bacterium]|nr:hypothetical protein [Nevskiaceae bacterium]